MLIEFQNVTKTFRHWRCIETALNGLSFTAQTGRVLGVLGPNGAGKTTAIKILLNLLKPKSGAVLIDGNAAGNTKAEFRLGLGYLPEERSLLKGERVIEQIIFLSMLKGLTRREAEERFRYQAECFKVSRYIESCPEKLSKGTVQRFCLIGAFINEPKLLILDEPFTGLDPEAVEVLSNSIREAKANGSTILISTHRMNEAEKLCDDVLFIAHGRSVFHDSLSALRSVAGETMWMLRTEDDDLIDLDSVAWRQKANGWHRLRLKAESSVHELLAELASKKINIRTIESGEPKLDEIFLRITKDPQRTV